MRACTATGRRSPPPDRAILRPVRRRAFLVLALSATAAVVPATASADVTLTAFSVEPSSKQGGGHPNVTINQEFGYSNTTDSVKDGFVRLQPGLLGNPQSAAFCSQEQFSSDSCPADSTVGSVEVRATAYPTPITPVAVTNPGAVYNLRPTGTEPARVGVVVEGGGGGLLRRCSSRRRSTYGPDPTATGSSRRSRTSLSRRAASRSRSKDRADLQRAGEQGPVHAHADLVRAGHVAEPRELVGGPERLLGEDLRDDADGMRLAAVHATARARWARRATRRSGPSRR